MGRSSKTNPLSAIGLGHIVNAPGVDPDYIMQLVTDVRKFADVLTNLKEAFQSKEHQDCLQRVVQERLSELVCVLKAVIGKHQTLNSTEILGAAGTVIAKVKGVNFKEVNKENKSTVFEEIYTSIDTLAFTFGNVVSDFLMGDVDRGSRLGTPQARRSRSFENLSGDSGVYRPGRDDPSRLSSVEEVDETLLRIETGVESALLYAKAWSKYTKDMLTWVEKRLSLDIDCAKSCAKMAESARALASQQDFMPFRDIYISAYKNEIEYSQLILQTATALQSNKFIQPLLARKNELDKMRKEIKEHWQKEQKKVQDAEAAVRKAKQLQAQRKEEYEKARNSTSRTEEEQPAAGSRTLEKKRRLEEEAMQKADEAREQYRVCVADAKVKRAGLVNTKSEILSQIRELVFQCDLTLKAVTVNWFQMQHAQSVPRPVNYQALCERAKQYEPGQRYAEFVKSLPKERVWLEALSQESSGVPFMKRPLSSTRSSHGNLSQGSVASGDGHSGDEVESSGQPRKAKMSERRCNSTTDIQALRTQGSRGWGSAGQGGGMCSDSESAGGSSESRSMDSPIASPGDFKRRLPRTPSTGTMSSADDLDEREPPSPSDNGLGEIVMEVANSPGPFRNSQLSKAAQTHKLRKLRAPSKCRECDSLVVFHGAECEECSLACHKKCLETLAIQCGHKKLQGRLHLFGIDFVQVAGNSPDGIPFIIKKCTSEIESRALNIKGIYRVNGGKSRVEKLCQAFENGKDLVELSELYPHDISNVLKLYLRQLPEPLILYRYYNDVIGLAKEAQSIMVDDVDASREQTSGEPPLNIELNRVIFKIRDLLRQLPIAHYKTLKFLIAHLQRVMEKSEENKMTASNLGIIFGPTLIKPRQMEAEVSLSSLVDYPYQALMVELLIKHYQMIFDIPPSPLSASGPASMQNSPAPSRDKESKLSRHSQSLTDIKEGSKVYKRHSSVTPSLHLLDEMNVMRAEEGTDVADESANRQNGVGLSADTELQKSPLMLSKFSPIISNKVQLRPPRSSRMVSRPISMPVERLMNERNNLNAAEHEPNRETIQEVAEPEKPQARVPMLSRNSFIDTQTLRRTWDKQYKHYNVTPRTAMIVANLPSSGVKDLPSSPALGETTSASGFGSVTTIFSNRPYTVGLGSGKSGRRDSSSEPSGSPITFREPRTLHPPPETFYKPPSGRKVMSPQLRKATTAASISTTTTTTTISPVTTATMVTMTTSTTTNGAESTPASPSMTMITPTLTAMGREEQSNGSKEAESDFVEAEDASSAVLSTPQSPCPSTGSDQLSPTEAKPLYQRLRNCRLQKMEQREAHFV
ncbi:rho GTPase-activating protein 29 [Chanos chanos]|uniref:Rho GTPase-activating protein 29 n=1 Tax=Chanos chanos TaxID=29144 RepID=A0A6J2VA24_CHACN|nr:rho GTPase-activating protein 29-like [Chanos chanos]